MMLKISEFLEELNPSPEQAGDRKHPFLLRRGGGGRQASGASQPGRNCAHQGGPQAPRRGSHQVDSGHSRQEGVPQRPRGP